MITVTNNNDSGAGSLRQAISDAGTGEEIQFSITGTITLSSGELAISDDLIITGPGIGSLTISGDSASRVFNIISGVVTISGLTITAGNDGGAANGGGISNAGTLTLTNISVTSCASTGNGGGIYNTSTIIASNLSVTGCIASVNGGGIWNNGTIGPSSPESEWWTGGEVSNCDSFDAGAGIYNDGTLTAINVNIHDNDAGPATGGGIWNDGTLTLYECGVYQNVSSGDGMGIFNGFGTVTLTRCAVTDHVQASSNAVFNNFGTVTINNSTVSTNTKGVYNTAGAFIFNNSTITLNGHGADSLSGCVFESYNTILAGNTTLDYNGDTADFTSNGWNIFGNNSNPITPGTDDLSALSFAALGLGALQNNGGFTETHAVEAGSMAIDAGNVASAPDTDQRGTGFPRVVGDSIDIGAYESDIPCLTFTGELPEWLTIEGNCLVVTPGSFTASTQAAANALAQAALDEFVEAALESGDLVCATPECSNRETIVTDDELTDESPVTTFRGEPGTFYSETFPISVVAGEKITIWCGAPGFDIWLILLDETATTELANNDSDGFRRFGDYEASVISWTPLSTGTLNVQVTSFNPMEVGAFQLVVSSGPEAEVGPMESPWAAIYVESTGKIFVVGPYEHAAGGSFAYVIDPVTDTITDIALEAPLSDGCPCIFYNPTDDSVWVQVDANGSLKFYRLDPDTGAILEAAFSGTNKNFFFPAYVPSVNKLFAGKQDNIASNKIGVYNCATRMQEADITIGTTGIETIGRYVPEIDRVVLQTSGFASYQLLNPNDNSLGSVIGTDIFIRYGFYRSGLWYGFEGSGVAGKKIMAVDLLTGDESFSYVDDNVKWGLFYDPCRDCVLVVTETVLHNYYAVTALNLDDLSFIDTTAIGDIGESNQWPSMVYAENVHRMYLIIGGNSASSGPPMLGTAFKIP